MFASPGHSSRTLDLPALVAIGTMSAAIAATLATAASERRSLLLIAQPRGAGKTTVLRGALAHAPEGTPIHPVSRAAPALGIPVRPDGGYLYLSEVSPAGFADYLWGPHARRVFAALPGGFSLATALHAPGVDEAFAVLGRWNEVPDEHAGRIDLAVYLEVVGSWWAPAGRRVAEVREIDDVQDARPRGRTLFRWDAARDTFEAVDAPAIVGSATPGGVGARLSAFGG